MENSIILLIKKRGCIRILEAHSGLSAQIVQESDYDGIWFSSLTDSASRGLPDIELIPLSDRIERIREIRANTTKPIIVDWDTGGVIEHFPYWVKRLEEVGVDAIVIEDKAFPKRNSLGEAEHTLEDIDIFARKIWVGKKAAKNILIIARIESLIAKKSVFEALLRAEAFLAAGVDGIVIHSKAEVSADEVLQFAKKFREISDKFLIAIPTTYILPEKHPFDIVIYANHLLRASYKAMKETARKIDEDKLATVKEILDVGGNT